MKQIELSKNALERIGRLCDCNCEEYEMIVGDIAQSQARLAQLVNLGRYDDSIEPWTDDLLKVMYTLAECTDLVQALRTRSDRDKEFRLTKLNDINQ